MDKDLLKLCLIEVEQIFNRGEIGNYGDYQFQKLSDEILQKTNVSVSVQTLKRLYGRISYKGEYTPQVSTKNALAQYIGFKDWDDFALNRNNPEKYINKKRRNMSKWFPLIIFFILVLGLIFFYSRIVKNHFSVNLETKHDKGSAPHTCLIHYSVKNLSGREVYIDFNDWSKKRITEKNGDISHLYQLPDLYRPYITVDNKKLASTKVYVQSTGWESGIVGPDHKPTEFYIPLCQNITSTQQMVLDKSFLAAKKLDTNDIFHYKLRNVHDFGISTDSITAKATVKLNTSIIQPTQYMSFRIIGDSSDFTVTFAPPGNFGQAYIESDDNRISGGNTDLKALEQDFSNWKTIAISIIDDIALIYVNDSVIIQNQKITKPGPLKGISFSLMYGGYIKDFLITSNGTIEYFHSFDSMSD